MAVPGEDGRRRQTRHAPAFEVVDTKAIRSSGRVAEAGDAAGPLIHLHTSLFLRRSAPLRTMKTERSGIRQPIAGPSTVRAAADRAAGVERTGGAVAAVERRAGADPGGTYRRSCRRCYRCTAALERGWIMDALIPRFVATVIRARAGVGAVARTSHDSAARAHLAHGAEKPSSHGPPSRSGCARMLQGLVAGVRVQRSVSTQSRGARAEAGVQVLPSVQNNPSSQVVPSRGAGSLTHLSAASSQCPPCRRSIGAAARRVPPQAPPLQTSLTVQYGRRHTAPSAGRGRGHTAAGLVAGVRVQPLLSAQSCAVPVQMPLTQSRDGAEQPASLQALPSSGAGSWTHWSASLVAAVRRAGAGVGAVSAGAGTGAALCRSSPVQKLPSSHCAASRQRGRGRRLGPSVAASAVHGLVSAQSSVAPEQEPLLQMSGPVQSAPSLHDGCCGDRLVDALIARLVAESAYMSWCRCNRAACRPYRRRSDSCRSRCRRRCHRRASLRSRDRRSRPVVVAVVVDAVGAVLLAHVDRERAERLAAAGVSGGEGDECCPTSAAVVSRRTHCSRGSRW